MVKIAASISEFIVCAIPVALYPVNRGLARFEAGQWSKIESDQGNESGIHGR